jgi:beta-glucosidase
MRGMGMDDFRFSISWSRVLPRKCFLLFLPYISFLFNSRGWDASWLSKSHIFSYFDFSIIELNSSDGRLSAGINEEGIQFYNNLIDELIKNSYDLLLFFNDSVSYYDPFKSRTRHGKFLNLPNFRKLCW